MVQDLPTDLIGAPPEPRDRAEQALHDHRPGTPGWAEVADVALAGPG